MAYKGLNPNYLPAGTINALEKAEKSYQTINKLIEAKKKGFLQELIADKKKDQHKEESIKANKKHLQKLITDEKKKKAMTKSKPQPHEVKERLFHCTTNGSNKWWEIFYWKTDYIYHYYTKWGTIGSLGQKSKGIYQVKDYSKIENLIKQKLKKGYLEVQPDTIGIKIKSPEKQIAEIELVDEEITDTRIGELE